MTTNAYDRIAALIDAGLITEAQRMAEDALKARSLSPIDYIQLVRRSEGR